MEPLLFLCSSKLIRECLQKGGAKIKKKGAVWLSSRLNFLISCCPHPQGKRIVERKGGFSEAQRW